MGLLQQWETWEQRPASGKICLIRAVSILMTNFTPRFVFFSRSVSHCLGSRVNLHSRRANTSTDTSNFVLFSCMFYAFYAMSDCPASCYGLSCCHSLAALRSEMLRLLLGLMKKHLIHLYIFLITQATLLQQAKWFNQRDIVCKIKFSKNTRRGSDTFGKLLPSDWFN